MDKKDFENLSESELRELKESIDEVLEEREYRESYLKTNPKGVAIAVSYTHLTLPTICSV